jgi:hypothetical protein
MSHEPGCSMVNMTRTGTTSASEEVGYADVEDLSDRRNVLWPDSWSGRTRPGYPPFRVSEVYGRGPLVVVVMLFLVQLKGRSVGSRAYDTSKLVDQDLG